MLPLRTDRRPAGAIALYGHEREAFTSAAHDIALLFAAQGGTAVRNAALYGQCREMVSNLHTALESRAVIEQAKGILHAETGVSPADAFELLSRFSQDHNRKVRKVAADLLGGEVKPGEVGETCAIPEPAASRCAHRPGSARCRRPRSAASGFGHDRS